MQQSVDCSMIRNIKTDKTTTRHAKTTTCCAEFVFLLSTESEEDDDPIAMAHPVVSLFNCPVTATNQSNGPVPDPDPPLLNRKGSSQLKRWSMSRSLRSGRKLERTRRDDGMEKDRRSIIPLPSLSPLEAGIESGDDATAAEAAAAAAKSIYMVSDGTGWTAEHSVNAALGQFDYCLVDRGCPVNTHLFSGVDDIEQLMEVVKRAAREGALVIYTLADPAMAESARKACELWGVSSTDILSPITESIATHLGVSPSGLPRWAPGRNLPLTDDYFRRIEAIEFTIKQDDGALPRNLYNADIVLTGVSRTGKTPLSIYLAEKGYKVANVPIVMGLELPSSLFEVDPDKVFGLTINPLVLHKIRRARATSLGLGKDVRTNYSEMDYVREELEFAEKVFAKNPAWPVIEVTGKAIEETASIVLKIYHERKKICLMPTISKHY